MRVSTRWLNALKYSLFRAQRSLSARPRLVMGVSILCALVLASRAGSLRLLLSPDDLVGDHFASVGQLRDLKESFKEGNSSLLLLSSPRGSFTAPELCVIRRWLSGERMSRPELKASLSAFDVRHPELLDAERLYYPPLLEPFCDSPERQKGYDGKTAFQQLALSPLGFLVTGREPGDLGIQLTYRDSEPSGKFGSFDPSFLKSLRQGFEDQVKSRIPGLQAHWVGPADYQGFVLEGLKKNGRLNLLMVVFLMGAMRVLFGTWRSGLLLVSTLIFSGVCIYGAKGWLGSPLDTLSNSLFLMLAIATIEDFVFIFYLQIRYGLSWRSSVRKMILPGFLTSVTTFIGFAALCVSDIEVIQRLGFWAAFGSLLEWVVVFLLLPALLRAFRVKGAQWVDPARAFGVRSIGDLGKRRVPRAVSWASMVIFPVAIASMLFLNINDAPHLLLPKGHEFRTGMEYLEKSRGWTGIVSVVFGQEPSRDFQAQVTEKLRSIPGVQRVETLAEVERYLASSLPPSKAELVLREFSASAIRERFVDRRGRSRINVLLSQIDLQSIERLRQGVAAACPKGECFAAAGLVTYADFAGEISSTLLESLVMSVFLVGAVLAWLALALGRGRQIAAVLATSFWGPAAMLALVGVFQLKVNFMTCIFATVLVGLTGDNAVQFLLSSSGKRRDLGQGVERIGGGAIQCSLVMALSSLLFLGSYFDPPRVFGTLLCAGFLAALLGDLFILKGLLPSGPSCEAKTGDG